MKYILFILTILLISSCEKADQVIAQPSSTPELKMIKENIKFEISSFKIDYEDRTKADSGYLDETYRGTAIISAMGDEKLVKKPYAVMVSTKKVSGGTKDNNNELTEIILVTNGIGTLSTSDWNFDKTTRMTKPVYEFKIIGYSPFIELTN